MSEAKVKDVKAEIAAELCTAFQRLGAKSELLRIVGSYGDTMDDYGVLGMLRAGNGKERK